MTPSPSTVLLPLPERARGVATPPSKPRSPLLSGNLPMSLSPSFLIGKPKGKVSPNQISHILLHIVASSLAIQNIILKPIRTEPSTLRLRQTEGADRVVSFPAKQWKNENTRCPIAYYIIITKWGKQKLKVLIH